MIDYVCGIFKLRAASICSTKSLGNQLLAVPVEEFEGLQIRTSRDLDQFGETVPNLGFRQRSEKGEVEKGMNWGVVGTESVLVFAMVNSHLNRDRSIDKTNDRGRNTNEICCSTICCACKSSDG